MASQSNEAYLHVYHPSSLLSALSLRHLQDHHSYLIPFHYCLFHSGDTKNSDLDFLSEDFQLVDGGRAAQRLGPLLDLKLLVVNLILRCVFKCLI